MNSDRGSNSDHVTKANTVGVISVAVPWFDTSSAAANLKATRTALQSSFDVVGPDALITGAEELEAALPSLAAADVLLLQIGTFPDGNAPARLAEALGVPIVVHSLPEPSLEHGIPLNSLCGANMSTFTLTALEHPHSFVHADPRADAGAETLRQHLRAALSLQGLRGQRVSLIGFRAPGFYPCAFDELLLRRRFGVRVEHTDLHEIFTRVDQNLRKEGHQTRFPTIEGGELSDEAVAWIERYHGALSGLLQDGGHDLVAIKDWPEIEHFDASIPGGFWPALSWAQDDGVDLAPEGDVNGAITMRIAHDLSGQPPFFADISAFDEEQSTLTLWHYGGATSLARDPSEIRFGAEGREVEFTLRPGPGHLIRLGLHQGQLRLLSIAVEILDERVTLRRAGATAKSASPAGDVVRAMLDHGWEHHVTLAYGDLTEAIRAFAKQAGLPLTEF